MEEADVKEKGKVGSMARDESYRKAEKKIEAVLNSGGLELNLRNMRLTELPESMKRISHIHYLNLYNNQLRVLPDWLGEFTELQTLYLSSNKLVRLPISLNKLIKLKKLYLFNNRITVLPKSLEQLARLHTLILSGNQLTELPSSLARLAYLKYLDLDNNPLNPGLAAAYKQGLKAVKAYLRAKADSITLNEAKLILIGEGEVGKTCLLDALLDTPWQKHDTTHGIEIKPVQVTEQKSSKEIALNAWDFGGQRVYRPTHQLFFSAPAVYLVVWKPREGWKQNCVKEWIQLIKHREPEAKILVIATHGGPQQRQPDIDRQELQEMFGKNTVLDFLTVESKPDVDGKRRGIEELKQAIAEVAVTLPEMGRTVPKSFQEVRQDMKDIGKPFLPLEQVLTICRDRNMDDEVARLFLTISHCLGHLIYYEHDPILRDMVVLKPDWLATAISFVLDDEKTRRNHGLVRLSRLSELWNDTSRTEEFRYAAELHPVFLALMGKYDLSYRVADPFAQDDSDPLSLIAQLVDDTRPEDALAQQWPGQAAAGDIQQKQICCIVDEKGQSTDATGLFYQLIVRLHKYSLGRNDHRHSIHWQRGLLLDDSYNGQALLEHKGNDVHITVRAPYPERFLAMLTGEVKFLVESFWEGLRCNIMVPCVEPCGRNAPGTGLFNVEKLIASKRKKRPEYPCPVCNEWQDIDTLLRNAPAVSPTADAQPLTNALLERLFAEMQDQRHLLLEGINNLDAGQKKLFSQVDACFNDLFQTFTDEAKEGPRLFSLVPVDPGFLDKPKWTSQKFRLILWCEHSRLPLFVFDEKKKQGIYELDFPRDWVISAAPFLKTLTTTLSLILPAAFSGVKLALDDPAYKAIDEQLRFGKDCFDATLKGSKDVGGWLSEDDSTDLPQESAMRAEGAVLQQLHVLLKEKDPGFGGLKKVLNKRREFLWVHPQFEGEY